MFAIQYELQLVKLITRFVDVVVSFVLYPIHHLNLFKYLFVVYRGALNL